MEAQNEPLDDSERLNVSDACDLVQVELNSPSYEKDYADAVNYNDFPDENAAELVFTGIVAEDICAQLGFSLR